MATLKLTANPTFKAKVGIPIPGGEPVDVQFEFRHKTKDEFDAFLKSEAGLSDVDYVLAVAVGWELTDEFNRESIEQLLQNYQGARVTIPRTYVRELMGSKLGN